MQTVHILHKFQIFDDNYKKSDVDNKRLVNSLLYMALI